jgi:hypothetical protein
MRRTKNVPRSIKHLGTLEAKMSVLLKSYIADVSKNHRLADDATIHTISGRIRDILELIERDNYLYKEALEINTAEDHDQTVIIVEERVDSES